MKNIIITSLLLTSMLTFSQEKNDSIKVLREVTVEAKQEKYKKESSTTVSKMPLKDIENPQVYSSIHENLLK